MHEQLYLWQFVFAEERIFSFCMLFLASFSKSGSYYLQQQFEHFSLLLRTQKIQLFFNTQ